jgi:hypothetical protein
LKGQDVVVFHDSIEMKPSFFKLELPPSKSAHKIANAFITTSIMFRLSQYDTDSVTYEVLAVMRCDNSWINPDLKDYHEALNHEKIHFMIAELFARRFRKYIFDNIDCHFMGSYNVLFKKLMEFRKEMNMYQLKFDAACNSGRLKHEEKKFKVEVVRELNELKKYSLPTVKLQTCENIKR